MTRPTILCISMSPIHRDARVLRQIGVLAEHGDVVSVGFGPKPAAVVEHLEVPLGPTLPQTPLGVLKIMYSTAIPTSSPFIWVDPAHSPPTRSPSLIIGFFGMKLNGPPLSWVQLAGGCW